MNSDAFPVIDSGKKNPIDSYQAHSLTSARWIYESQVVSDFKTFFF